MPPPETYKSEKSGVILRYASARSILVHTSHYSRLEKLTLPLATRESLPPNYISRIYIARSTYHYAYARQTHLSLRIRTTDASQLEKKKKKKRKEDEGKKRQESEKRKG